MCDSLSSLLSLHTNASDACYALQQNVKDSFTFPFREFIVKQQAQVQSTGFRFGHTNELSQFFSTNTDSRQDYIFGLVWFGGIIAGAFFIWLFLLFVFYCLGPNRIGYLSGTSTTEPEIVSSSITNNEKQIQQQQILEEEMAATSLEAIQQTIPKTTSTADLKVIDEEEKEQQHQILLFGGTAELSDDTDSDDQIFNVLNVMDDLCNPDNVIDVFNDTTMDMSLTITTEDNNDTSTNHKNIIDKSKQNDVDKRTVGVDDVTILADNLSPNKGMVMKHNSSITSNSIQQQQRQKTQQPRRSRCNCQCSKEPNVWIRRIFIVSGIFVITGSILFVVFGLYNLQSTISTYNTSANTIVQSTNNATTLLINVIEPIQQQLVSRLVNYSSELITNTICPSVSLDDIDQLSTPIILKEFLNSTISLKNTLQYFATHIEINITEQLIPLMDEATATANNVRQLTSRMDVMDWKASLVAIPYILVSILLLAKILIPKNKTYRTCMVWILFPIFVLLIVVAAMICSIGIMSSVANSDLCYSKGYNLVDNTLLIPQEQSSIYNNSFQDGSMILNSPDATILLIAQNNGYPIDSRGYQLLSFYVSQCSLKNPFSEFEEYLPIVQRTSDTITDFVNLLRDPDNLDVVTNECNRNNYDDLIDRGDVLYDTVILLQDRLLSFLEIISCPSIVPIYQSTLYDGSCDQSIDATIWIFYTTLCITIFGSIMITFRSVMYTGTGSIDNTIPNVRVTQTDDNTLSDKLQVEDYMENKIENCINNNKNQIKI